MIGLLLSGCMSNEIVTSSNPIDPVIESSKEDWKLIFGTSMDGDIEPCG